MFNSYCVYVYCRKAVIPDSINLANKKKVTLNALFRCTKRPKFVVSVFYDSDSVFLPIFCYNTYIQLSLCYVITTMGTCTRP